MKFSILKYISILLFCFGFAFAQEKQKASLFDSFEFAACEEVLARQDAFFVEIQNFPDSIGYAVIHGKKNETQQNLSIERVLKGNVESRRFYEDRLVIIRGKESEKPNVEFWLVPANAEKPDFEEATWDFTLRKNEKPFVFYSLRDEGIVCPDSGHLKNYSEFLTENSTARANTVISAKSKAKFQKQKLQLINELTGKYDISPNRIRSFFVKVKPGDENYELWLLP